MTTISANRPVPAHIRWMIRKDLPEVFAIELASFDCPWFELDFIRCMQQRNSIGMVADLGDRIAGYMIYELGRTRIRLLNFAVHPHAPSRVRQLDGGRAEEEAPAAGTQLAYAGDPREQPGRAGVLPGAGAAGGGNCPEFL